MSEDDDPKPLRERQARRSLAQRLGRTADRVRGIATRLGVRPYRVFLRWTKWTGAERGEGTEQDVCSVELLPTPLVTSLDSVSFSLMHSGTVPVGSVRVGEVSVVSFTEDNLRGLAIPDVEWLKPECADADDFPSPADLLDTDADTIKQPYSFFYEVVEDARHDDPAARKRFRLLNTPMLKADNAEWTLMLERMSPDQRRGERGGVSPFRLGSGR